MGGTQRRQEDRRIANQRHRLLLSLTELDMVGIQLIIDRIDLGAAEPYSGDMPALAVSDEHEFGLATTSSIEVTREAFVVPTEEPFHLIGGLGGLAQESHRGISRGHHNGEHRRLLGSLIQPNLAETRGGAYGLERGKSVSLEPFRENDPLCVFGPIFLARVLVTRKIKKRLIGLGPKNSLGELEAPIAVARYQLAIFMGTVVQLHPVDEHDDARARRPHDRGIFEGRSDPWDPYGLRERHVL